MREAIGLIFFIILLVLWSKVFAHQGEYSNILSAQAEVKIENIIQSPLGK